MILIIHYFFSDGVHKEDVEAIRTFQKQGNLFGLCTGRQLEGIKYPFGGNREHPLTDIDFDFYITLSGGVIFNKKEEVIFEKEYPYEYSKRNLRSDSCTYVYCI